MTAKIQLRRDTSTNWNAPTPPTLDVGEIGYDTTLKQIKIGNGSSNWAALPWLAGTFPVYASPSSSDLNNSSNSVQGVYRFTNGSALTNAPASPINIVANDGGATMLVIVVDSHVVQQLWTDGDGSTQVPKSYSRVYDNGSAAWRPWTPQNSWGISATEGVELVAKSITLKDTGTGLTVDGNSTLTGDVTVNGKTTLGNNNLDVVTVYAGSVGAPIITTNGDSNTGIYFPAADTIAVSTNGTQAISVNASQLVTLAANLTVSGQLAAALHCGSQRLTNVGTPTASTDAISNLQQSTMTHMGYATANGNNAGTQGTINMVLGGFTSSTITINPQNVGDGSWCGIAMVFNGGNLVGVSVKARNAGSLITSTSALSVTGSPNPQAVMWFLTRVLP
jgi:hypothetical protein